MLLSFVLDAIKFLGNYLTLQVLLSSFLVSTRAACSLGSIFLCYWGEFLHNSLNSVLTLRLCTTAVAKRYSSQAYVKSEDYFL